MNGAGRVGFHCNEWQEVLPVCKKTVFAAFIYKAANTEPVSFKNLSALISLVRDTGR